MKDAAHDDYVFRTKRRRPWDGNDVVHEFHKLVVKAKATSPGFYSLRHTFATVGARIKDRKALATIMGHAERDNDMIGCFYDHGRATKTDLLAITNVVHAWLFPPSPAKSSPCPEPATLAPPAANGRKGGRLRLVAPERDAS